MAKDIFSKIIKDYNNDLEMILEKKAFSEDVKNLLLSMLYKIENSYADYKKVKVQVCEKGKFIEEILETIDKKCKKIEIIKSTSEEAKTLYEQGENCIIDRENGIIKTLQNEKSILDAISKIKQEEIIINDKYELIEKPVKDVLYIGNNTNTLELITDFNGWSWDVSLKKADFVVYDKLYQMLILLIGNKQIDAIVNNRKIEQEQEVPNNVILSSKYNESFGITKEEMKETKLDTVETIVYEFEMLYGKELTLKFMEDFIKVAMLECCNQNKDYKNKIVDEIGIIKNELTRMNDNKIYLEHLSIKKKELAKEIEQLDKVLNNEKDLKKEYEEKNKKLPNKEKIFSVSHFKLMLEKQRERKIEQIKSINKKMEPKEFVKIKKEIEDKLKFYEDINIEDYTQENKIRLQKKLEKTYLQCFNKKIEKAEDKKEIENIIYELRYFKQMPLTATKNMKEIEQKLINKACEQKVITRFSDNEKINYQILKQILNIKIIDLETLAFLLKYTKGILTIKMYDGSVEDETFEIEITEKVELQVKLNKKIKIWQ